MDEATCRRLFATASRATLATTGARGPHIVPIVFVIDRNWIYTAIDHKPKTTTRLQRLANVERNPQVAVLADYYADDWETLWWVRADGRAKTVVDAATRDAALDILATKYATYQTTRPGGPVLGIDVRRWTGWSGAATTT